MLVMPDIDFRSTSTKAIGARLKLTREASGESQVAFCNRIGVTTQSWNNYERGRDRISIDQALKVVLGTGVSLDWIYRGERGLLPLHIATALRDAENGKDRSRA